MLIHHVRKIIELREFKTSTLYLFITIVDHFDDTSPMFSNKLAGYCHNKHVLNVLPAVAVLRKLTEFDEIFTRQVNTDSSFSSPITFCSRTSGFLILPPRSF